MTSKPTTVLLVDDHPPFRMGMRLLLEQEPAITVIGEADNGADALRLIDARPADVVVLDCQLPDMDGPAIAAEVRKRGHTARVLALSAYDDIHYVRGLLSAGASGYLLKNEAPAVIVAAVQAAAAGRAYFSAAIAAKLATLNTSNIEQPTARELDVLKQLVRGLTNVEIARELDITERTVRFHMENLFGRLGVENRVEAVMKALEYGWVERP